jgi:hypothetical protein
MIGADRFRIFSVGMNSQVSAIEAFMQEFEPDLIVVDGRGKPVGLIDGQDLPKLKIV